MKKELTTERLHLSRVTLADASEIRRLAGNEEVARSALNIPHPFEEGLAEAWIAELRSDDIVLAMRPNKEASLIGLVGLIRSAEKHAAELSYWVGQEHWNMGYATEAAAAVVAFGFDEVGLQRIFATTLADNPSSGRVLEKIGFQFEGRLRQHVKHWGDFKDLCYYGVLQEEYGFPAR